ncbi:hypothetical protein [Endozoicomonas sp.]|uniref:hypothetical protein n=1 Tax=Endozoicomonas sp. TaxID=1892382 RepID=UPI00383B7C52
MNTHFPLKRYSRQTSESDQCDSGFGEGDEGVMALKGQISGMTVTKKSLDKKLTEENGEKQEQAAEAAKNRLVTLSPPSSVNSISRQFKKDMKFIRTNSDKQVSNGKTKPDNNHPVAMIKYMQKLITEKTKLTSEFSENFIRLNKSARKQVDDIQERVELSKSTPHTLTLKPGTQKFQLPDLLTAIVSYYVLLKDEPKARDYISAGYKYYGSEGIVLCLDNAEYDLKQKY